MSDKGNDDPQDKRKEDPKDDDEELDALLDDALEGFEKVSANPEPKEKPKDETVPGKDVAWSEEFMKQASLDFERNIRQMMSETSGGNPDLADNLFKVSQEAAAKVFESQSDQGVSFAETLKNLAEGTSNLQSEPDEATLTKMLESMAFGSEDGFGEAVGGDLGGLGDIFPAMQGMLQSLLSKELLYPSIKDIVNKYPDWLADNRSKLEASQYDKYNRQYAIMQQVCTEFEKEKETDDAITKSNRFDKILSLMQQMQECGHPPKELAGEAEFMTDLPQAGAENCVVM